MFALETVFDIYLRYKECCKCPRHELRGYRDLYTEGLKDSVIRQQQKLVDHHHFILLFFFSRVILEVHWPAKNPVADGFWLVWSAGEWDVHVQITMEYTPGSLKCWAG